MPKKWDDKLRRRQQLYRAGKLKINPMASLGRTISEKKTPYGDRIKDHATFACPFCETDLKDNLIRLRPGFYECRNCGKPFTKEDAFDENDNWIAEGDLPQY